MTIYCCGFLFSPDLKQVALIRKSHPDWQKGKLNGVGGHIQEGEAPGDAMEREFSEEAGVHIPHWRKLCILINGGTRGEWCVHFFYKVPMEMVSLPVMNSDEPVDWYSPDVHTNDRLPNLRWLIPMARSLFEGQDKATSFRIQEEYGA